MYSKATVLKSTVVESNKVISEQRQTSWKRVGVFLIVLALGGMASLAKSLDLLAGLIVQLENKVGGDVVLHLAVSVCLGASACWAGMTNKPKRHFFYFSGRQAALIVLSVTLVSLDEATQYFISTRTFSVNDWLANMVGLFIGIGIYQLFSIYRIKQELSA